MTSQASPILYPFSERGQNGQNFNNFSFEIYRAQVCSGTILTYFIDIIILHIISKYWSWTHMRSVTFTQNIDEICTFFCKIHKKLKFTSCLWRHYVHMASLIMKIFSALKSAYTPLFKDVIKYYSIKVWFWGANVG